MPKAQGITSTFEKATGSKDSCTNFREQGQDSSHLKLCWGFSSRGTGDRNHGFRQGGSWKGKGWKQARGANQCCAELGFWRLLKQLPWLETLLPYPAMVPQTKDVKDMGPTTLTLRHNSWRPHPAVAVRISQDSFPLLCTLT